MVQLRVLLVVFISMASMSVFAKGGGGHGLGFGIGAITPNQQDLDQHITDINSANSAGMDKFGSAYEFAFTYQYEFGIFGLVFRPSYFTQSAKGGNSKYDLNGFTVFPMFRVIPLSNNYIAFFLQAGVGYGMLTGKLSQKFGTNEGEVNFQGGSFGSIAGMGAKFCFGGAHCMMLEGNLRYLSFDRINAGQVTGSPVGFSQAVQGQELEVNNKDLGASMSGVQGLASYVMTF